jgi:hypothetical protein
MLPRVSAVKHLKDYELELAFTDGTVSTLDFRNRVTRRGGVFAPFESIDFFKQVSVDPEAGTIVWPNGVDLCPDVLYEEATATATKAEDAQAHA